MRRSVAAAWVELNDPIEGTVPWMYLDRKGLVTSAMGNMLDAGGEHPWWPALEAPWVHIDGQEATAEEVRTEWLRVKHDPVAAQRGHRYTEGITDLRLTREGIQVVVERKLVEMDHLLARRFPEFEEWPADAQLATLSLSWACGPNFRFPILEASLRNRDFDGAVLHCNIADDGVDAAIRARNRENRKLYMNASRVLAYKLDPDVLVWPGEIAPESQS